MPPARPAASHPTRGAPRRGRPASIDVDHIVGAGVTITQRSGLAALSLQGVAAELGVTPRSLYHYVSGIGEIRQAVVDHVVSMPIDPPDDLTPHDWLVAYARRARALFVGYPGVAGHVLDHGWLAGSVLAHLERCVERFGAAGIEQDDAVMHAVMFLWWIATFVVRETSWAQVELDPTAWMEFAGPLPQLLAGVTVDRLFEFELAQVVASTR